MNVYPLLFASLFFFSTSLNIIRDLPYNIYQIEDMNQYETKYLPEGNRFYIRLPSSPNKESTTFYLSIPRNTTIFPIYSKEFPNKPSEEEIINTEYNDELQLKNRDDQEYSIYSYDIQKSDSYKVLYFQNNEILNYLSFSTGANAPEGIYRTLPYKQTQTFQLSKDSINNFTVALDIDDEKLLIITEAYYSTYDNFDLAIAFFDTNPTKEMLMNYSNWDLSIPYSNYYYSTYEERTYEFKNLNKQRYLGIRIKAYSRISDFEITVKPDNRWPTWLIVIVVIIGALVLGVFLFFCLRTEGGRAACLAFLVICECLAICCPRH